MGQADDQGVPHLQGAVYSMEGGRWIHHHIVPGGVVAGVGRVGSSAKLQGQDHLARQSAMCVGWSTCSEASSQAEGCVSWDQLGERGAREPGEERPSGARQALESRGTAVQTTKNLMPGK